MAEEEENGMMTKVNKKPILVNDITEYDIYNVCRYIRYVDLKEAQVHGVSNKLKDLTDFVTAMVSLSDTKSAIKNHRRKAIGLCGVAAYPDNPEVAIPWMITTDEMFSTRTNIAEFLRNDKQWLSNASKPYKKLVNVVHSENAPAIKWLKRLGFTFPKTHKNYMNSKDTYFQFEKET